MSIDRPAPQGSVINTIQSLLDRGYTQTSGRVVNAIVASTNADGSLIQKRLSELDDEAVRLREAGEKLAPDNAYVRALLADLEPVLSTNGRRIDGVSGDLQTQGADAAGTITRQLALPGMSDAQLRAVGIAWNRPDPEAVNRLVGYVDSPAWASELGRYPQLVLDVVNNQAIMGIAQGWNPLKTARAIRQMSEGLPAAQANTLMRTLHLQSYRSATAIHQQANADILEGQIRIAALDDRTCMACIALHGTALPLGARVNDHHNGRCTSVAIVRGRPRSITTGEQWFDSLPRERKLTIAGPGKLEAIETGRAQMRDFVQPYDDDVFGEMIREASLKGVLG